MRGIIASPRPRSHRGRRSSSRLTNTPFRRGWSEALPSAAPPLRGRTRVPVLQPLLPSLAAMKGTPSSLDTVVGLPLPQLYGGEAMPVASPKSGT